MSATEVFDGDMENGRDGHKGIALSGGSLFSRLMMASVMAS